MLIAAFSPLSSGPCQFFPCIPWGLGFFLWEKEGALSRRLFRTTRLTQERSLYDLVIFLSLFGLVFSRC